MPDSAVVSDLDSRLAGHPAGLRRTFAIISHPDAGKTTLTEKLLLFGGAIHVAGADGGGGWSAVASIIRASASPVRLHRAPHLPCPT